jgi:hypothetical protein
MNQDKMTDIFEEECRELSQFIPVEPRLNRKWGDVREALLKFVAEVDRAVEIYQMESKGVNNGNAKN